MHDESVSLLAAASPTAANCGRSCNGIVINRYAPRKREREVRPDLTSAFDRHALVGKDDGKRRKMISLGEMISAKRCQTNQQ